MRFLCVDDEPLSLRKMNRILTKLYPDAEVICAEDYREALAHAGEAFTAAFLDVEMPEMNGLDLAIAMQEESPQLNVIFVTAYDEYALKAYQIYASGYVTKPFDAEAVSKQLANLRYPDPTNLTLRVGGVTQQQSGRMRVRCFGYFEVFVDDEPLIFDRRTSKEILAYLIHIRGAAASRVEICTALWEDVDEIERKKGYFRSLIASLRATLRSCEMEDILVIHRDSFAVNTSLLDCDYLRYMDGDKDPQIQFHGEYMSQYSWGEDMIANLNDWSWQMM